MRQHGNNGTVAIGQGFDVGHFLRILDPHCFYFGFDHVLDA